MRVGLSVRLISEDEYFDQFEIRISDSMSSFSCNAYLDGSSISHFIGEIEKCTMPSSAQIKSLCAQLGNFKRENVGGGISIRLFPELNKIRLIIEGNSQSFCFGEELVSSKATFYLLSEYVLIDNFVVDLKSMLGRKADVAFFDAFDMR